MVSTHCFGLPQERSVACLTSTLPVLDNQPACVDIPTPKSLGGFGNAAARRMGSGDIFRINNWNSDYCDTKRGSMGLGNGGADQFGFEPSSRLRPRQSQFHRQFIPAIFKVSCFTTAHVSSSPPSPLSARTSPGKGSAGSASGDGLFAQNLLGNFKSQSDHRAELVNLDFSLLKTITSPDFRSLQHPIRRSFQHPESL